MRVTEISDTDKLCQNCVLTVGNFDGVHLGHQAILAAAKRVAANEGTELAVMTFVPHPVTILQPERSPGVLTPFELKAQLLEELGVDCLIRLKGNEELLALSADEFVRRFLVEYLRPAAVIEGEDFNFGRDRRGNINGLQQMGADNGFEVCVVPPEMVPLGSGETVRVSSTLIRNLLETGAVEDAARALGRRYRLMGCVVRGHGKGKQLGFPTANLGPSEQIVPAEGVYAGFVEVADTAEQLHRSKQRQPAALSLGRAATLGRRGQLIEAHLLAHNVSELVGKWMAMDFVQRHRGHIKFENEEQMSNQIRKDSETPKRILTDRGCVWICGGDARGTYLAR
jgi:riboflavin kinase/FMN adenylyltransferase